jgi:hypothetical protein
MGSTARTVQDRAPRFPVTVPLSFRKSGMSHWIDGHTINISRTGILFRTEETIPQNSSLDIRVNFPTHPALECQCTVVRTDKSLLAVHITRYNFTHSDS